MKPPPLTLLPALLLAPLLGSCSVKHLIANNMQGLLEEVEGAFMAESSYAYGQAAGPGLLLMLDGVIASSPRNGGLLELGARMNAQYAMGFLEGQDPAFAASVYSKALDYGLRALDEPRLDAALYGEPAALALVLEEEFDADDVPLLFWTGLAFGSWIDTQRDSVRAVAQLPNAVEFMERVLDLEPGFFHGSAHLFRARYYGRGGSEIGGDPERARAACHEAWRLSGERLLLARVYEARYAAVPTQDSELFESLLFTVLEAPDDILPELPMATAIAKHEAERLLLAADDYFVGAP